MSYDFYDMYMIYIVQYIINTKKHLKCIPIVLTLQKWQLSQIPNLSSIKKPTSQFLQEKIQQDTLCYN